MSARHARPPRWRGSSRVLAFGVASLAIAAVGTTQGTGAFYYDAVHIPVTITAPRIAQECYDAGFGRQQGSKAGFNHAVLVVGTPGDDTLVLHRNGPAVDRSALLSSPLAGRLSHPTTGWTYYAFDVDSWTVGAKLSPDDLGPQNNQAFIVLGGAGDDVIIGDNKNDCLVGGEGSDLLYGDNSEDVLIGGPGHDWIFGGNGVDTDCSAGDAVNGGNGPDECDRIGSSSGSSGNGNSGHGNTAQSTQPTQSLTRSLVSASTPSSATTGTTTGGSTTGGTTSSGTTTGVTTGATTGTTTGDTTPPVAPDQAAGPSQEGTTG